jgi:signal transduction histidine kinase
MASLYPGQDGPRRVLRILAGGFLLVVLLLGLAAYIASREARQIQSSSAGLVADHLKTARLIDAFQVEQQKMDRLLFQISASVRHSDAGFGELAAKLDDTSLAIDRTMELSPPAASRRRWTEIGEVSRRFKTNAARVVLQPNPSERELEALYADHEKFVTAVGQLVKEDAERSVKIESAIEEQSRNLGGEATWFLGGCFVLAMICAALTVSSTLQTIREMERQSDELQRVSWHMLQGQEAAARRFSHELHDELGQSLAGLKALLTASRPGEIEARRPECLRLVDDAISNVRELSQLLRPVILDDFGLASALTWLSERFQERTKIEVDCQSEFQSRLGDETETQLFRITQEALTNVARHSGATIVRIRLRQHDGTVYLLIEDNGRGLPKDKEGHPSIGLVGMRARARQVGGDLLIGTSQLKGVKIEAAVPATQADTDANEHQQEDAYIAG